MHIIRIYTGNRNRDGLHGDVKFITSFNGYNSALYAQMHHMYPEGNGYIWLH